MGLQQFSFEFCQPPPGGGLMALDKFMKGPELQRFFGRYFVGDRSGRQGNMVQKFNRL
jgi:hypothetical protein